LGIKDAIWGKNSWFLPDGFGTKGWGILGGEGF